MRKNIFLTYQGIAQQDLLKIYIRIHKILIYFLFRPCIYWIGDSLSVLFFVNQFFYFVLNTCTCSVVKKFHMHVVIMRLYEWGKSLITICTKSVMLKLSHFEIIKYFFSRNQLQSNLGQSLKSLSIHFARSLLETSERSESDFMSICEHQFLWVQ